MIYIFPTQVGIPVQKGHEVKSSPHIQGPVDVLWSLNNKQKAWMKSGLKMKIDGMSSCQAGRFTEFGGRESEERMTKEAKMAAGHAPCGRPRYAFDLQN